jgi:hypothetical protein
MNAQALKLLDAPLAPPCYANRLNIALATVLAAFTILKSTLALSAEDEQSMRVSGDMLVGASDDSSPDYTVELKPLPTMMSLLPGGFGAGGEVERRLGDHLAIFAGVTHMRLRLSEDVIDELRDDQGEDVESIPRLTTATRFDAGARWYGDAHRDSWFVGAKAGVGATHVDWVYDEDRLEDDRFAWMTEGDLGYRWLWDSGLTVRLGVGIGASVTTRREVAALTDRGERVTDRSAYKEARQDIDERFGGDDGRAAFLTAFDLGVGYSF